MRHAVAFLQRGISQHRPAAERLQGLHADKAGGGSGHHHLHLMALFGQQAYQLAGFVGGDAAADAEQDVFAVFHLGSFAKMGGSGFQAA